MNDFIAIDVETANDERSSICSIGAVKVKNGKIVDEYYTLINPETYFSFMNTEIHGLSEDDVIDAPKFYEIADELLNFIDDYVISAHFASFDMFALQDVFYKYNITIPKLKYFCSYRLSKYNYFDMLPSFRLSSMAKHFNINNEDHHNALNDAKVSALITLNIMKDKNLNLLELIESTRYKLGILGEKSFLRSKSKDKKIEVINNPELHNKEHEFYDKNIAFTGTLQNYTRNEIAQVITDIGAHFNKSVVKKTNILVVGNLENLERSKGYSKSSKIKKAELLSQEGLPIEILSELDFIKLL